MNRFLAQLDRRLNARGELIELRRTNSTSPLSYVQCRIPAIVRALTVEQLIGAISQQNYFLIISPTHILRQQWPGGTTAKAGDIMQAADPRLPTTSDAVFIRGAKKTVQRVAPVFDRGECIRIELSVLG